MIHNIHRATPQANYCKNKRVSNRYSLSPNKRLKSYQTNNSRRRSLFLAISLLLQDVVEREGHERVAGARVELALELHPEQQVHRNVKLVSPPKHIGPNTDQWRRRACRKADRPSINTSTQTVSVPKAQKTT